MKVEGRREVEKGGRKEWWEGEVRGRIGRKWRWVGSGGWHRLMTSHMVSL